jgi:prepilin-type N-terminal cleavage/methylation domain-containing protein
MVPMNLKFKQEYSGFSLIEALVVVVILGLLSTIAVNFSRNEIDRGKINSAQISLAGWLQVVQRSALLQKSSQISQGGCSVTFPSSFANQGNGATIANVSPAACSPYPDLFLDIPNLGNSRISASFTSRNITFTPRGTVLTSDISPSTEIKLIIDGSSLLRCIKISGLVGVIEIGGKVTTSSLSDQCTDYTRI